jgi:hypothetical protein
MANNEIIKAKRKQFAYTDSQISAFTTRLDSFLFKELSKVLRPVLQNPQDKAEALQILGSLFSSLEEIGLKNELQSLKRIYGSQIRHIREEFESLGIKEVFSDTDVDIVGKLIDFDTEAVSNKIHKYTDDVGATVMRSVLAGEEPDFSAIHERVGASLARQVETETQTLLAGFSRAVTTGKAKELGFTLFMYLGPDDKVTRPFCAHVLERDPAIYTIEEIQALNGHSEAPEGLDVMLYGGGYNCRHDWRPLSEESAKEMGWTP